MYRNKARCSFHRVLLWLFLALVLTLAGAPQQSPVMAAAAAQDTELDRRIKALDQQVKELEERISDVEDEVRQVNGGKTYLILVYEPEDPQYKVTLPVNRAKFEEWVTLEILSGSLTPEEAAGFIRRLAARSKALVPRLNKNLDYLKRSLKVAKDTRHKLIVQRAEGSSGSGAGGEASLAGDYDGGDWGPLTLTGGPDSYTGRYQSPGSSARGTVSLTRQSDGSFKGTWSEPGHHGTITARRDGRNISTEWVCVPEGNKKGRTTWVRK